MQFATEYAAVKAELGASEEVIECAAIGSALYREDAQDLDVVVLLFKDITPASWFEAREPSGMQRTYDYDTDEDWMSTRQGVVNFILTNDEDWYDRCIKASQVCEVLGLADKRQRKLVYRVIRDEMTPAQANLAVAREEGL